MNTLIAILVIIAVIASIFWILDQVGIPAPFNWIVRLIVGLIGIIALLKFLPGVL